MSKKVVCILSGGMDSTTLLYDIKKQGYEVHALSFDYNQKHRCELEAAKATCKKLEIPHRVIGLQVLNDLAPSALTRDTWDIPEGHYAGENMKQTVVPNRNMVMLSLATSFAIGIGATKLFYGAHSGDHCLVEGTKILTVGGLKAIEEVVVGEKIYSYNLEKSCIEKDVITQVVRKGTPQEVLEISSTNGETLLCTSEHKVYRHILSDFTASGWVREIVLDKAGTLEADDYLLQFKHLEDVKQEQVDVITFVKELLPQAQLNEKKRGVFIKTASNRPLKAVHISTFETLIKIIAWYITEGWTTTRKKKGDSSFNSGISQSAAHNLEYVLEITGVLNELLGKEETKLSYSYNSKREVKEVTFNLSGTLSAILQTCGKTSKEKYIPEPLMNLLIKNKDLRDLFLTTMIKGDGHTSAFTQLRTAQYITSSSLLKEQMIFLCRINGFKLDIRDNKITLSQSTRKPGLNTYDNLYFNRIKASRKIQNKVPVYDITVKKNHNFFAGEYGGTLVSNSIYPDCKPEFITAMAEAIALCDWTKVTLEAPYAKIDKGDIAIKGKELNVDYSLTWTCYNPKYRKPRSKKGISIREIVKWKPNTAKLSEDWVIGLIEGEGTFGSPYTSKKHKDRTYGRLTIYQQDSPELLQDLKKFFGWGGIYDSRIEIGGSLRIQKIAYWLKGRLRIKKRQKQFAKWVKKNDLLNFETYAQPCGKCGACVERLEAFKKAGITDPLPYKKG